MAKLEVLIYTEKELAAIEALKANKGDAKTASELGVSTATLESLVKKYNDPRPMADGSAKFHITKSDIVRMVEKNCKGYSIED